LRAGGKSVKSEPLRKGGRVGFRKLSPHNFRGGAGGSGGRGLPLTQLRGWNRQRHPKGLHASRGVNGQVDELMRPLWGPCPNFRQYGALSEGRPLCFSERVGTTGNIPTVGGL